MLARPGRPRWIAVQALRSLLLARPNPRLPASKRFACRSHASVIPVFDEISGRPSTANSRQPASVTRSAEIRPLSRTRRSPPWSMLPMKAKADWTGVWPAPVLVSSTALAATRRRLQFAGLCGAVA